jgi:hypothetical protein
MIAAGEAADAAERAAPAEGKADDSEELIDVAESTVPREAAAPGATEAASSSPAPGGVAGEGASAAMDADATNVPRELAADEIERDAQASWQAKLYYQPLGKPLGPWDLAE